MGGINLKLGFWEIMVILVVALLVIGPDKLPYYTKKLGLALKEFRKVSADVTKEVRESVIDPLEEAQKPLREAIEPLEELKKDIEGNFSSVEKDFKNLGKSKKDSSAKKSAEKESPEEPAPAAVEETPSIEMEQPTATPTEVSEEQSVPVPDASSEVSGTIEVITESKEETNV